MKYTIYCFFLVHSIIAARIVENYYYVRIFMHAFFGIAFLNGYILVKSVKIYKICVFYVCLHEIKIYNLIFKYLFIYLLISKIT